MANLLALSPVLVLLLGALAVLPSRPYPRLRPFISLAAVIASLVLLQVNARQPDLLPYLFPAFASAPDLDLTFSFSPAAVLFSSVALVGFLSLRMIGSTNGEPQYLVGRLATLAGMVAFFLAANWTTLAAAWLLADLGLLIWSLSDSHQSHFGALAWRTLALSQFGALVFLGAGVLVLNGGSSLRFANAALVGLPADLVLVAAWIRSGLYPFQPPLSAEPRGDRSDRFERGALTVLLGAYLIIRALIMMQGDFSYSSVLYSLALLGVGATALLVWGESEPGSSLGWAGLAFGTAILLTPFVAILAARAALVVWLGLGLFNFSVIVAGAGRLRANTRRRPLRRILWGAAILAAAGFPMTPGFLGRVGLYAAAIGSGQSILVAALTAATTLALVPLWRSFLEAVPDEVQKPNWLEYLASAALLFPMIAEGLVPFVLTAFFGREVEDASTLAFDALFHAPNALGPLLLLGAVLLPLPLAFAVVRARRERGPLTGHAPKLIMQVLDLSAFGRGLVLVLDLIGVAARQVSALIEQHPLGWILFAAIWVAVWLLNGLGGK